MSQQIIYILTNEAMPGYVKIGKTTTSLEQRVRELSSSTNIPFPFTCFYACTVSDCTFIERQLHDAFGDNRVNPRREFFQIDPERVVAALKMAQILEITPGIDIGVDIEEKKSLEKVREKLAIFNFDMVGIPIGAELIFSRDITQKAKVINNRSIEYNGIEMSLSESARQILGYKMKPQGPAYWMYEGETLTERRTRFETAE